MTVKRVFDLCAAAIILIVSVPLLVMIAIAVKLDSPGPILFTQIRVGRGGRLFRLYKFRSMFLHAEQGSPITAAADARITRLGAILRPLRLDELPQLINVLKGEMSLVGPRPEPPSIVKRYTPEQRQVFDARPGITGPTQLAWLDEAGRFPAGLNAAEHYVGELLPQKLQMDVRYVQTRTFLGDLGILFLTPLRLGRLVLSRPRLGPTLKITRLVTDCALVGAATYAAFFARFDGIIPADAMAIFLRGLPFELLVYGVVFLYLTTYRSIWRYAGVEDCWQLGKACLLAGGLNAAGMHITAWPYPRSVLLLTPAFSLLLLAAARLTWRTTATALAAGPALGERRRVVIVGAGRTGASIARELLNNPTLGYDVVGFVDDNRDLRRAMLHNLPVLGTTDDLPRLTQKHGLLEAIIAIPRPPLSNLRRIRESCVRAGLAFKTLPSLGQLVSGDGQVRYLRKVDVGELLQRETVPLQREKVTEFLRGKRVMVTGAGGSIGSELCRQLVRLDVGSLLMVERAENSLFSICGELQGGKVTPRLTAALADVKHMVTMSELFGRFRPEVVFHTAAYKHVPMLEAHPAEAVLNNVVGTARLANLAAASGVESFIFISTDKAVRPNNLMGATKRICELYLMALDEASDSATSRSRFRIVRFGNVLGSNGSALPLFQRQIENGGPITITDPDVSRFFMTITEAVGLVLESTTLNTQGGIAVLDMGEPIKITTLADDFITALGLPPSEVPRQFIGLRPGEKLHEVLWDEMDEVLPAPHPRIAVVRPRVRPLKEIDALVRQLEQLAVEGRVGALLAKVHELVPSYIARVDNGAPPTLELGTEPRKPLAVMDPLAERIDRSA